MKWGVLILSILIVGCASQVLPESNTVASWQSYGEERAENGHVLQSQQKLSKLASPSELTSELYQAYATGYQAGKEEYCSQSAYMLGRTGRPYRGICDDVNPFFKNDYVNGRAAFL